MPDVRVVGTGQNDDPIIAAHVRALERANALTVVQVNASGDIVNPGGAGGSGGDGAINDGADSNLKATVKDYANANPLTVVLVNVSGDVYNAGGGGGAASNVNINEVGGNSTSVNAGNADNGTLRVVVATDQPVVNTRQQGTIGVQIIGGGAGASGDLDIRNLNPAQDSVRIHGGQVAVTGDVLLRVNSGVDIGNVGIKSGQEVNSREQAKTGVHVAAGSVGVTGDVSTTPAAGQVWPTRHVGTIATSITGDGGVSATVRDYTNGNPIAVVQTNTSGDSYGEPTAPALQSVAGRVSSAGSNSIVGAVAGRRIKVTSFSLQGDGDNARGFFASGASGAQLTAEWELASREGVVKQVDGGRSRGFLFATSPGGALSFESSSARAMKYDVTYHVEDAS